MPLLNWSMTMIGYHAHALSGARVLGVSHMSAFAALAFARDLGLRHGWLQTTGPGAQIPGKPPGAISYAAISDLLEDMRSARTEGLVSGSLLLAAVPRTAGEPPQGAHLRPWAESRRSPWVQVIDNEHAYWGGLDDQQTLRLLTWFLCQRPIEVDWRKVVMDQRAVVRLRGGLLEHGWTRNLELVRADRGTTDLWGGVHRSCLLDHGHLSAPSRVGMGLRLRLDLGEITAREITDLRCPLNDETGRADLGR